MTSSSRTEQVKTELDDLARDIERALGECINSAAGPPELTEAMKYAVLGGGKRLRPAIVILAAQTVAEGKPLADPMPGAVAIELIHCYSLVHDDLPAMDDDKLRRGRPTVHVQFGDAMAVLVGDALLTQAFAVLAERVADPIVSARLTGELARAAGPAGMIAGQVADMSLCRIPEGLEGLRFIHARKTGALLGAAARMGAVCGGADEAQLDSLGRFGVDLGLAFQVTDDLLDATASSKQIGKTAGKDAQNGKRTYPGFVGVEKSTQIAQQANRDAVGHLDSFGKSAETLRALATWLLERTY